MGTIRVTPLKVIRTLCGTLVIAVSLTAAASSVWLSGPSALTVGESALFTAARLSKGALVVIVVTEPSGYRHRQMVNVGSNGTVTHELLTTSRGVYTVQITNRAGDVLATARLVVA